MEVAKMADMVVDMEDDNLADMVLDMEVDKVAEMVVISVKDEACPTGPKLEVGPGGPIHFLLIIITGLEVMAETTSPIPEEENHNFAPEQSFVKIVFFLSLFSLLVWILSVGTVLFFHFWGN